MISLDDQLAAVERLIEDLRWARADPSVPEHATYNALKVIAADLRGRMNGAPGEARRIIGNRIAQAVRSKGPLGYEAGQMQVIAQEVIGRWPAIEYALERAERESILVEISESVSR